MEPLLEFQAEYTLVNVHARVALRNLRCFDSDSDAFSADGDVTGEAAEVEMKIKGCMKMTYHRAVTGGCFEQQRKWSSVAPSRLAGSLCNQTRLT